MSNEEIRFDIVEAVTDTPNDQDALVQNLAIKYQEHEDVVLAEIAGLIDEDVITYNVDWDLVPDERPTNDEDELNEATDMNTYEIDYHRDGQRIEREIDADSAEINGGRDSFPGTDKHLVLRIDGGVVFSHPMGSVNHFELIGASNLNPNPKGLDKDLMRELNATSIGELESVSGVSEHKARRLSDAGYRSVSQLKAAHQQDLSDVDGIGNALAARIKADVGNERDGADSGAIFTPEDEGGEL